MKLRSKTTFYSLLFAVFLLTYMVTLSVSDDYVKGLNAAGTITLHYIPGITRIIGFISFWFIRRFILSERTRRIVLITTATLFLISSVMLMTCTGIPVTLTALLILSLSLGHLGGLVYYCISIAFETSSMKGRIIGSACALSVFLQFVLTGNNNTTSHLILTTLLFLLISCMLIRTPADFVLEDPLPYAGDSEPFLKDVKIRLFAIITIILLCSLLACRTDIAFLSMSFDGSINIYSYPRLAMIPGYLLMGFAADLKKPKYFSTAFICALILSAILVLMPFRDNGYMLFLSVYYFFISVYIFFYTYTFVSIAPRTKMPELWASIGRPLSDLFVAPISFALLKLSERGLLDYSPLQYALYYFILLIVIYIVISVIDIDPNLTLAKSTARGSTAPPILDEWLNQFPLTPREKDVARLLIETDIPVKTIASELGISERSVYRFASSIYEKTGTDNRTGLMKEYMKPSPG